MITHTKYNGALCKKQLLNAASNEALGLGIDVAHNLTSSVAEVFTELGHEKDIEEDTNLQEAENLLELARNTVTIPAAVSLVEILAKGSATDDLTTKAKELLDTKVLPEALRLKVKAIADAIR